MKGAARKRRTGDSVELKELSKNSKTRKEKGYLWKVETRRKGVRKRKFFRYDQKEERDAYIALQREAGIELACQDRDILNNTALIEEASRLSKRLAEHGKTLGDAVTHYLDFLEVEAIRDNTPIESVIAQFLDEKEREGVSELHWVDLRQRLARFSKAFPERGIASFSRKEVSTWILGLEVGPQAKINQRRILHNLFQFAVDNELIQSNPVATAAKGIKVRRKKTEILSPEEVATLLENSPEELLPALVLMTFCGIRKDEVGRLEWQDIDWEDSTVEISGEKAKREVHARHVTIPENAVEWIQPLAKRRGLIAPYSNRNTFTKALQNAREAAGWQPGEWPNNACRKTFISHHYESFGSIDQTAKEAGTSVDNIHRYYRKLIKQKQALRLWEIRPSKNVVVPISNI